ncbi:glycosyl hydrolase (plasmid) [Halostagnicola larsenii XH-48]|uniref:Glycosyl hydrolase n=1 Tax=Halostagnicola larsenii XH-48 TaxID=797299 RepID=W0JWQ9_9EURY|nr:ThuA domain-containing protein [Halostagnicola larsenii]AHG01670.1 glycosyl hydrolase [Halostagnicola larsenii XH-48]
MPEPNAVVLGGNRFPFHRLERLGPVVEQSVEERGIDADVTTDRDVLLEKRIREYDVLVDMTTDSTLSDRQESGLRSFAERGGGYVGVHGAADLTTTADERLEEPIPELRELIGGHFLGHPEQSTFDVNVVDSHHSITADLDGFTVWDEPYVLEYDDDVRVLARMDHPQNGDMPVAWVKPFGDGRVFYCSLGHDLPALRNDGVQALLERGIRWAARND